MTYIYTFDTCPKAKYLKITSVETGAIAFVCIHLLNMCDIILVGDDIVMLLS